MSLVGHYDHYFFKNVVPYVRTVRIRKTHVPEKYCELELAETLMMLFMSEYVICETLLMPSELQVDAMN